MNISEGKELKARIERLEAQVADLIQWRLGVLRDQSNDTIQALCDDHVRQVKTTLSLNKGKHA